MPRSEMGRQEVNAGPLTPHVTYDKYHRWVPLPDSHRLQSERWCGCVCPTPALSLRAEGNGIMLNREA